MQATINQVIGGVLLVLGLYVFTRCRLLNIKTPESHFSQSNEKEVMADMFSFLFGLLIMYYGYCLISSFAVAICILAASIFIFTYLKNYYLLKKE